MEEEIIWPTYKTNNGSKHERNLAIYKARVAGKSYKDIGLEFNRSPTRVYDIYQQGVRLLKYQRRLHAENLAYAKKYRHEIVQMVKAADPEVLKKIARVLVNEAGEGKYDWEGFE